MLPVGDTVVGRDDSADLVLASPTVSRQHARFERTADAVIVHDLESRNGTFVNGDRVTSRELGHGDELRLGNVTLMVTLPRPEPFAENLSATLTVAAGVLAEEAGDLTVALPASVAVAAPEAPPESAEPADGIVPESLLRTPIVAEAALAAGGVEVQEAEYVALGGGMGSFVFSDLLRCSGVSRDQVAVIGTDAVPYERYRRLCTNSQIPAHERLRSNSDSCPDNVWGFPGYATREAWGEFKRGKLRGAASALWSVFGEPAIAPTYTPRSGDVFASVDEEASRIGWASMLRQGRIRAVRKTDRGRLAVVVSHSTASERRHSVVLGRFAHLALGYPAIQMLPDLANYREAHGDRFHVVNAYEDHEAVYANLREHGGTVVLRGRGIVASRVLQKLWEERRHNPEIRVVHLHRSRLKEGHSWGRGRRAVADQFEFQPFNWPKAAWGGEHRAILEAASDEERAELLGVWGGTTTASRADWQGILSEGTRDGWYQAQFGAVREVVPGADGKVITRIASAAGEGSTLELPSDFIIDCVGLEAGPGRSPVIADLMETYDLRLNPLGRLAVSNDFEVMGMRHDEARMFAAGAVTLGGPYAAVDSFLGLQYAALRAAGAIRGSGLRPEGLRRLSGLYSFGQWLRWVRGVSP